MKIRRIRTKLLIGFAIVVGIIALQAGVEYWRSTQVEILLGGAYASSLREEAAAGKMLQAATKIRLALNSPSSARAEVEQALQVLRRGINEAIAATRNSEQSTKRLKDFERAEEESAEAVKLESLGDDLSRLEADWKAGRLQEPMDQALREQMRELLDRKLIPGVVAFHEQSSKDLAGEAASALQKVGASKFILSVGIGTTVLAAIVASLLLSQIVVSPLEKLTKSMERIGGGERELRIALNRWDEFGIMAGTFNTMLDSLEKATVNRLELEAEVSQRTRELDQFFVLSVDMLTIADFSGKFLRVNPAFTEILGYSTEELVSRPFAEFIHPEDREATEREMEKYRSSGAASMQFENRYICKDGTWRRLSWNAKPVQEAQLIFAVARDVTELRLSEQTLREKEQSLSITLQSIGEGVVVGDAQGRIVRMNPVAELLTGWVQQKAEGRPIGEVLRLVQEEDGTTTGEAADWVAAGNRGARQAGDMVLTARDGTERKISYSAAPIRDGGGKVSGEVLVFRDVTQERLARKMEQERLKRVARFQKAILTLRDAESRDPLEFFRLATEECAQSLELDRASIWRYTDEHDEICCEDLFERGAARHSSGMRLQEEKCPDYFEALGQLQSVVAEDAASHAATRCLGDYLAQNEVCSMLDAPIRSGGRLYGVLCCEQTKASRKWTPEEVKFVNSLANAIMLAVEHSERVSTERKLRESEANLRELNETLEKRVEKGAEELASNERRFRQMVEQVEDYAIFVLDRDGIVSSWNAGAQRTKGYEAREIIGRHYSCFYRAQDVEAGLPKRLLEDAARTGHASHEGWRVRKDGSLFWADVDITAIRESGVLKGFAKVTRDLTERRQAELTLREAFENQRELTRQAKAGENAKSEFLAIMSHEVRTPMNGIIGYADLLAQAKNLSPENRAYAHTLYQSGRALLRILDDILDFSSMEAGTLNVERVPFSLRQLLEELRTLLEPEANKKGLALLLEISPTVPEILMGDPGRLRQIVLNLTGNALKFTETGYVRIAVTPSETEPGARWRISIRDTGPGVPADRRDAIFAPFIQADASSSRQHGGTGLGLTISKRLAELLGGTLTMQSEIGAGSEFLLELPIEPAEQEALTSVPLESPTIINEEFAVSFPLQILVVEDDTVNMRLTLTILRKLGYEPWGAANGLEAVDVYRQKKPTCILMDLQMPTMDGLEATQAIREIEKAEKLMPAFIIALTANTVEADRDQCFKVGMNDYLNKPIRRDRLSKSLARASQEIAAKAVPV